MQGFFTKSGRCRALLNGKQTGSSPEAVMKISAWVRSTARPTTKTYYRLC